MLFHFYSTIATRIRHNRRWEIINFKFDHNHFTIVRTIIHLYIRGREWIHEHYPDVLEQKTTDGKIRRRDDLIIMIHYVVPRSSSQNLTHTMKLVESRHRIPSGLGQWVQFEIKHVPPNWLNQNAVTISLAIKTQESWMRSFLVIDTENSQNKEFPLHIEAFIKQPRRQKRSTSLDCQESDHEVRCCRYPLKVNFTNFGWNFVIAPTSFDAYFCNGECKVGYLEQYTHTHIASLTTSATPCCSPTKMSPLSLLYFDQDHNLVLSTIPNMSVEKCSCS
ncbi:growth/differentiation factor 8 [Anastrepha obliqua]|uniref:growth/differentiation factor 8 n=1 Tax=Anastrepha obliqua TaxID=95512 RepID=UPI00240A311E|nr:growth/differentiation factor 8 [Anastrepha obliqua]